MISIVWYISAVLHYGSRPFWWSPISRKVSPNFEKSLWPNSVIYLHLKGRKTSWRVARFLKTNKGAAKKIKFKNTWYQSCQNSIEWLSCESQKHYSLWDRKYCFIGRDIVIIWFLKTQVFTDQPRLPLKKHKLLLIVFFRAYLGQ
jgi:hypothetical protein